MHRPHLTVSDHPVSDKVGIPTQLWCEGHGSNVLEGRGADKWTRECLWLRRERMFPRADPRRLHGAGVSGAGT